MHVHRQVVTSRQTTLLQCEPQLSCSVERKDKHLPQSTDLLLRTTTHACAASKPPAPCALPPSGSRKPRSGTTATEHMFIANNAPMLWWHAASKSGHHMSECRGKSSSEDASSLAADPAKEPARATSRAMKLPLVRGVAGSRAKLEQVRRRVDQNIEQRCGTKKELGRKRKNWAPGATWSRLLSVS